MAALMVFQFRQPRPEAADVRRDDLEAVPVIDARLEQVRVVLQKRRYLGDRNARLPGHQVQALPHADHVRIAKKFLEVFSVADGGAAVTEDAQDQWARELYRILG